MKDDWPAALALQLQQCVGAADAWAAMRQTMLPGLVIARELGGQGMSALQAMSLMEHCGYVCDDRGALCGLGAHLYACTLPMALFGSAEQRPLVRRLASGDAIGAHCATEPDAGSDVFACQTRVQQTARGLRLSGTKSFISNAQQADIFLVLARDVGGGLAFFIVERDPSSMHVQALPMPGGLANLQLCSVHFDQTPVADHNRLGGENDGALIFSEIMRWERALLLSHWLGIMKRIVERCYRFADSRKQFDAKLSSFQAVSMRIADMWCKLQAARAATLQAAQMLDAGKRNAGHSCLAKLLVSTASVEVVHAAIQTMGSGWLVAGNPLAGLAEYAYSNLSISGTTDMQRGHIFKSLRLEFL